VSSAILYLAIVVIWAFLLVPRWVRRPHTAFFAGTESAGHDLPGHEPAGHGPAGSVSAGSVDRGAATRLDTAGADADEAGSPAAPRRGVLRAVGLDGDRGPSAGWHEPDQSEADQSEERERDYEYDQPEPDTAPIPAITVPGPETAPAPAQAPAASSASPADASRPAGPAAPSRPPISRTKILQARRRLLTTLVLLAIAAVACTALKLTSAWVCGPPAGMLGMYLLLLREASLADAEKARRRAEHVAAARERARARSRQAWAARTPQPTAEVIDISARLGDQLYDQYADATVRAVGD
jgi:hypothetical protein